MNIDNFDKAQLEARAEILNPLNPYLAELHDKVQQEFIEYLDNIIARPNIRTDKWQIGYMQNNIFLSKLIPKECVVVDVGCGFGFQQILFKDHQKYIGIQQFLDWNMGGEGIELKTFIPNAFFEQGWFRDKISIFKKYKGSQEVFGIANISLLSHIGKSNEVDLKLFNEYFIRKFVV